MENENMVYIHYGILLSCQQKGNDLCLLSFLTIFSPEKSDPPPART